MGHTTTIQLHEMSFHSIVDTIEQARRNPFSSLASVELGPNEYDLFVEGLRSTVKTNERGEVRFIGRPVERMDTPGVKLVWEGERWKSDHIEPPANALTEDDLQKTYERLVAQKRIQMSFEDYVELRNRRLAMLSEGIERVEKLLNKTLFGKEVNDE
jgi:hypothetical protein